MVCDILRYKALFICNSLRKSRITPAKQRGQRDDKGGRPNEEDHQADAVAVATLVDVVDVGHCPVPVLCTREGRGEEAKKG